MELNNKNVLFVDDEKLILEKIKLKLNDSSLNLFFAENGKTALKILENKTIAVIVCDLNMPNFTGIEFLKITNSKYPKIPKIIFSIYSEKKFINTVKKEKIFYYLPKNEIKEKSDYQNKLLPFIKKALREYHKVD
jgi:YesN/AraC family two-component response regulator